MLLLRLRIATLSGLVWIDIGIESVMGCVDVAGFPPAMCLFKKLLCGWCPMPCYIVFAGCKNIKLKVCTTEADVIVFLSWNVQKRNSLLNVLSHTATSHAVLLQAPVIHSNPDSHGQIHKSHIPSSS